MEFGMKRVMASVQAIAVLDTIYNGAPVPLAAVSKESKLSAFITVKKRERAAGQRRLKPRLSMLPVRETP
jgi:hypothetical protein